MNLDTATARAREVARQYKKEIALVHAPLETAGEGGEYGFCPIVSVPALFSRAIAGEGNAKGIVAIFDMNGEPMKKDAKGVWHRTA